MPCLTFRGYIQVGIYFQFKVSSDIARHPRMLGRSILEKGQRVKGVGSKGASPVLITSC